MRGNGGINIGDINAAKNDTGIFRGRVNGDIYHLGGMQADAISGYAGCERVLDAGFNGH